MQRRREFTKSAVSKYREVLQRKHDELRGSLTQRAAIDVYRLPDAVEDSVMRVARDIEIVRLEGQSALLHDIEAALRRIENGTYGLCETCGSRIGQRRLDAMPWTPRCVGCQEQLEVQKTPESTVDLSNVA